MLRLLLFDGFRDWLGLGLAREKPFLLVHGLGHCDCPSCEPILLFLLPVTLVIMLLMCFPSL
jgi:hypothetical protein